MQITHVVQGWAEQLGGGPRYFRELSLRAASAGHDVTVLTTNAVDGEYFWDPSADHVPPGNETVNGVELMRFPVRHLPLNHWKLARALALLAPRTLGPHLDPPTPWVPAMHRFVRSTDDRPDVVHATGFPLDNPIWAARTLARRTDCPLLLTPLLHFGRGEEDMSEFRRFYDRPHQRIMLEEASVVFVLTEIEADVAVDLGARPEAVSVIGIGVEPSEISGGDGPAFRSRHDIDGPILLHIATRAVAKGSDTVLEAARLLWNRGENVTLVMAGGSMPCFRACLDEVRSELPDDRFIDLGYIDEREKRDALAAADVFALPSRADAFGIVFLEAWLNDMPVIGARAGGIPAVIEEGADGLLVDYGDAKALADAVAKLLAETDLAQTMARIGHEKVLARYTWDKVFKRVMERYEASNAVSYGRLPAG
ncbi:MAG: glycosyltransferase family 4 protein [Armatimonadota bacterium]